MMNGLDIYGWVAPGTVVLAVALMVGCASDPAGDEAAAPDAAGPSFPSTGADAVAENPDLPEPVEDVDTGEPDGEAPAPQDVETPDPQDVDTPGPEDVEDPGTADAEVIEDVCATAGCELLAVPDGGCVDGFECDPDFTSEDGTHCKPVYKSSGSPCLGTLDEAQVHVVASGALATDEAASVCDRFVCHGEAEAPSACVLASTLPVTIQVAMEVEGFFINHECAVTDMPGGAAADCNHVQCVCATDACLDAQCQVTPDTETLAQPCEGLDMCWTGTCTALGDQPYMCVQHPVACPILSDAWCAVTPACDPVTGCPVSVDQDLSDAKCGGDDPCLISASCDPDNTDADAETGCVTVYEDPESGCGDQIVGISAGGSHSFAIQGDGTIHWWGTKTYAEPPEGVLFKQVAGGKSHTCGIDLDGNVHCWGLQDGGNWDFGQVTLAPTEGTFTYAAAGYNHSCAIREDGTALCWGIGSEDNLEESQEPYEKGQVTDTPTDAHFRQIGAGHGHTCGLKTDGTVVCWGTSSGVSNVPTGSDFVSLTVGFHHNCALDSQGALTCWGWSKLGLIADVPDGTFLSVSCGYGHTCAVRTTGEVVCWGVPNPEDDAPQVIDSGQATGAPVEANFKLVGVNNSHSCAVTNEDKVVCWGSNGSNKSTPPVELQP